MKTIAISVRDKIAVNMSGVSYTCGNSDCVINFDFDAEWDDFSVKTARFIKDDRTYQDQVFQGNECPVPVLYNTNKIRVGVYAGNLHTSTPAIVKANKGILCWGGSPEAPSEDVYAQIIEMLNNSGSVTPAVKLDTTLSVAGRAADAKAVGDALTNAGTKNYTELNGKPSINGVELTGNKTSADLGIGNPTDEQVAENVKAWLDEHPEATTTVADGSISTEKLADGAVSAQKTDFIRFDGTSANLFNKNATTDGYELEAYAYVLNESASYCVSDFIPVEANTTYQRTYSGTKEQAARHINYFDSEKAYISAGLVYQNFTTPANCSYIRIELLLESKDTYMIVKGDTLPSEYIPYEEYYALNGAIGVTVKNIKDLEELFGAAPDYSIPWSAMDAYAQDMIGGMDSRINVAAGWNDVRQPTQTKTGRINVFENVTKGVFEILSDVSDKTIIVHGVNYFNADDLVDGIINASNGVIKSSNTAVYTDKLIPVQPGKILYWNRDKLDKVSYLNVHFYNENQEWVRRLAIGSQTVCGSITPNDDEYYIRICLETYVGHNGIDERLQIADVDVGNTYYHTEDHGYDQRPISGSLYFGKVVFFPYVGYRIINGSIQGASNTYTVEEVMHIDVFDTSSTVEAKVPVDAGGSGDAGGAGDGGGAGAGGSGDGDGGSGDAGGAGDGGGAVSTKPVNCMIMAHRGYHATVPQNTIESFKEASLNGFNWIEVDIQRCADGVYVLSHDTRAYLYNAGTRTYVTFADTDYTTIKNYTWDTDGKYKLATLQAAFNAMKVHNMRFVLDRKSGSNAELLELASLCGALDKVMLSFASPSELRGAKDLLSRYNNVPVRVIPLDYYWLNSLTMEIPNPMYCDINATNETHMQQCLPIGLACHVPVIFSGCTLSNTERWIVLAAGCMANLDENISYLEFVDAITADYDKGCTITVDNDSLSVEVGAEVSIAVTSDVTEAAGYIYGYSADNSVASVKQTAFGTTANFVVTGKAAGTTYIRLFTGSGTILDVVVSVSETSNAE